MRCLCPYRSSVDVDFGVPTPAILGDLLARLEDRGTVEILERGDDTVHLEFDGINVSVFVLPQLVPFVEDRSLTVTGILATKLHAILDRGRRRDFFDLYVTLELSSLGVVECLAAVRRLFEQDANESLFLRSLTSFDDAEREPAIPGEGPDDWKTLKSFFLTRVGHLLVPPTRELSIQGRVVDVRDGA